MTGEESLLSLFENQSHLFRWTTFCQRTNRVHELNRLSENVGSDGVGLNTAAGEAFNRWLTEHRYALASARPETVAWGSVAREHALDDWIRSRR